MSLIGVCSDGDIAVSLAVVFAVRETFIMSLAVNILMLSLAVVFAVMETLMMWCL